MPFAKALRPRRRNIPAKEMPDINSNLWTHLGRRSQPRRTAAKSADDATILSKFVVCSANVDPSLKRASLRILDVMTEAYINASKRSPSFQCIEPGTRNINALINIGRSTDTTLLFFWFFSSGVSDAIGLFRQRDIVGLMGPFSSALL